MTGIPERNFDALGAVPGRFCTPSENLLTKSGDWVSRHRDCKGRWRGHGQSIKALLLAVQSHKAVTACFLSKQLPPFGFADRSCLRYARTTYHYIPDGLLPLICLLRPRSVLYRQPKVRMFWPLFFVNLLHFRAARWFAISCAGQIDQDSLGIAVRLHLARRYNDQEKRLYEVGEDDYITTQWSKIWDFKALLVSAFANNWDIFVKLANFAIFLYSYGILFPSTVFKLWVA